MSITANVTTLDDLLVLIPVTGEGDEPSEEEETQEIDGVSEEETPENSQEDERLAQLQAQYERLQSDLNKQKSVFQQREHEIQIESQKREAELKEQLDKLRRSALDPKDADKYEKELALERLEQMQQELEQERARRVEREQFDFWKDRFLEEYGVKRSELVLDQGVQELVASGMEAIKQKLTAAPKEETTPKKAKSKQEPPETPKTTKGAPSDKKLTLKQAADKYSGGDIDALFGLWETGQLPRDLFDTIAEAYEQ